MTMAILIKVSSQTGAQTHGPVTTVNRSKYKSIQQIKSQPPLTL